MKRLLVSVILSVFFVPDVLAQQPYDAASIPAALREEANAVKRMEEVVVKVKDKGKAVVNTKYAITVLNESGERQAVFAERYSKLISVKSIEGTLYDAKGNKIRSLKKSEVSDISDTDESSLADDGRARIHDFGYHFYPFTVEYEYNMVFDGIFYFYSWTPVEGLHMSVQQSSVQVECPADYEFRYKAFNYPAEPVKSQTDKSTRYFWEIKDVAAVRPEKYTGPWYDLTPVVRMAPADFEFQGYTGSMRNWLEFGKFIYTLNNGRDVLPDKVKQDVHRLTDAVSDPKEKVRILYDYLQKSTRYISVQLGIGGWQTFDAKYVAGNGYGDCKALTNYLYSILKEAGIKSFYTLIYAGRGADDIVTDFPSSQFNHIILCALTGKDSTWVECTSSTLPAGYLGDFTSNRHALLVDENGGTLVKTPAYSENDNLLIRNISGTLDAGGKLHASIETSYQAEQYDMMEKMLHIKTRDKQLEALKEMLPLSSFDATEISYQEIRNALPVVRESLTLSIASYASITGKRLFINPNLLSRSGQKLNEREKRKYRIYLRSAYTDIDTVRISLPPGFSVESKPENKEILSEFGSYYAHTELSGGSLLYIRKLIRKTGVFPPEKYAALAGFLNAIYKADRESIVFVKE